MLYTSKFNQITTELEDDNARIVMLYTSKFNQITTSSGIVVANTGCCILPSLIKSQRSDWHRDDNSGCCILPSLIKSQLQYTSRQG